MSGSLQRTQSKNIYHYAKFTKQWSDRDNYSCSAFTQTSFPPARSALTSSAVNLAIDIDFTRCVNSRLDIYELRKKKEVLYRLTYMIIIWNNTFQVQMMKLIREKDLLDSAAVDADKSPERWADILWTLQDSDCPKKLNNRTKYIEHVIFLYELLKKEEDLKIIWYLAKQMHYFCWKRVPDCCNWCIFDSLEASANSWSPFQFARLPFPLLAKSFPLLYMKKTNLISNEKSYQREQCHHYQITW